MGESDSSCPISGVLQEILNFIKEESQYKLELGLGLAWQNSLLTFDLTADSTSDLNQSWQKDLDKSTAIVMSFMSRAIYPILTDSFW